MWNKESEWYRTGVSEFEIPGHIWGIRYTVYCILLCICPSIRIKYCVLETISAFNVTMGRWDRNKCLSFCFVIFLTSLLLFPSLYTIHSSSSSSSSAYEIYADQTIWGIREEFQIQSLIRVQNCQVPFLIWQGHS